MKSLAAWILLAGASAYGSSMSGNLINGTFETDAYFKQHATPDGGTPGTLPIPNHRFSQAYDFGRWLTHWGQPSLSEMPGYPQPAGGGFSMYDNPRDPILDMPPNGDGDGVNDMFGDDIGNMNRSVDPLRPGNHILDNTMFYPSFGTAVVAPANQVRGPIDFKFDFFYDDWDTADDNIHTVVVYLYGLNFKPTDDNPIFNRGPGSLFSPLGGDPINNPVGDGQVVARFNWGGWFSDPDDVNNDIDDTNGWQVVDVSTPNVLWDQTTGTIRVTSVEHPFGWDYYVLAVDAMAYNESHLYFGDWYGRVTDTFTQGFDNFELKVLTALLGDTNLDGKRDALDIQSFVARITGSLPYLSEADTNQDGLNNALDIQSFVYYITHPLTGGQAVPEPATLGLLALGLLGVARRR